MSKLVRGPLVDVLWSGIRIPKSRYLKCIIGLPVISDFHDFFRMRLFLPPNYHKPSTRNVSTVCFSRFVCKLRMLVVSTFSVVSPWYPTWLLCMNTPVGWILLAFSLNIILLFVYQPLSKPSSDLKRCFGIVINLWLLFVTPFLRPPYANIARKIERMLLSDQVGV